MNDNDDLDSRKAALFNNAIKYADKFGNRRGLSGGLALVEVTGRTVDVIARFGVNEHGSMARQIRIIAGDRHVFEAADRVSTRDGKTTNFAVSLYIPGEWEKHL